MKNNLLILGWNMWNNSP